MKSSRPLVVALCLVAAGLAGGRAFAQESHFKVYGGFGYVAPMSDSDVTFGSITDTVKAEQKAGWNLGIELRWSEMMGLELDYLNATQDVSFGGTVIGETDFSPLTATLNFHLVHKTAFDFYVGPSYSYVNWGDIELNGNGAAVAGGSEVGTDSATGWGVSTGMDFGFGPNFAVTAGLRYLNVDLQTQGGGSSSVDPLIARLGVAFRF